MESNSRRMDATFVEVADFISQEFTFKYNTIRRELIGEAQPFVEMAKQNIEGLQQDIIAVQRKVREMEVEYPISFRNCEMLLQEMS